MSNELYSGQFIHEDMDLGADPYAPQKVTNLHQGTVLYAADLGKPELNQVIKDRESELSQYIVDAKVSPSSNQIINGYLNRIKVSIQECGVKNNMDKNNLISVVAGVLQRFYNLRLPEAKKEI